MGNKNSVEISKQKSVEIPKKLKSKMVEVKSSGQRHKSLNLSDKIEYYTLTETYREILDKDKQPIERILVASRSQRTISFHLHSHCYQNNKNDDAEDIHLAEDEIDLDVDFNDGTWQNEMEDPSSGDDSEEFLVPNGIKSIVNCNNLQIDYTNNDPKIKAQHFSIDKSSANKRHLIDIYITKNQHLYTKTISETIEWYQKFESESD